MPVFSVWTLGSSDISVSGGGSLSGITQGDASHLAGLTITLNAPNWTETRIDDDDSGFDDNDGSQILAEPLALNGTTFAAGTRVEAEYTIVVEDPDGNRYTIYGYNLNNSSPNYATVEGLAFLGPDGAWPPVGVPLSVVATGEGPGSFGNPQVIYEDLVAPICFVAGTRIAVPGGWRAVEQIEVGDLVETRDHGPRPVRWIGARTLSPAEIAEAERVRAGRFAPVRVLAGALGPGRPMRDLRVSPQHRLVMSGWRPELHFGEAEVLVAACHLVDGERVINEIPERPVTYVHLMFDRHEIVLAEGLPAESFRAGASALGSIPVEARAELFALFPDLADLPEGLPPARPVLTGYEAMALRG